MRTPGSEVYELEAYTDIFSPQVDFVNENRYSGRIPGVPDGNAPYVFSLLDPTNVLIPGAEAEETWSGCVLDPPRNHAAIPPGGTATSLTLGWSSVAGAQSYQIEIGDDNQMYFGAVDVTSATHVLPWASFGGDAPGSPDGRDMGNSLGELPPGEYHIQVGSRVPDCFSADHDAELHFRKEGNTITFFEPAG